MKAFLSFAMPLFILLTAAQVRAENPSKDIWTFGTAELPAQIKVIDRNGEEVVYETSGLQSRFRLTHDSNFSMGQTTMCDPGIGRTSEELKLPINITDRSKYMGFDNHYNSIMKPIGGLGRAVLVIPKGSNAYGHCQSQTNRLESITFQTATPEGSNDSEHTFKIIEAN